MSNPESKIGWLSPVGPPENVIIDASGNEIVLTPEQLAQVKSYEQAKEQSFKDLMKWLGIEAVEEAETFLADLEARTDLQ